jgi:hypothetical protein
MAKKKPKTKPKPKPRPKPKPKPDNGTVINQSFIDGMQGMFEK